MDAALWITYFVVRVSATDPTVGIPPEWSWPRFKAIGPVRSRIVGPGISDRPAVAGHYLSTCQIRHTACSFMVSSSSFSNLERDIHEAYCLPRSYTRSRGLSSFKILS